MRYKDIDVSSITSSFEVVKSKTPDVFKTISDIESFIGPDHEDGISDYKAVLNRFQAQLHIFTNHSQDHSIKENLKDIQDQTFIIFEFIKRIVGEYNACLQNRPNSSTSILKLAEVKKYSPEDADTMKEAIAREYAHSECVMFEYVNDQRIQILKSIAIIENYIVNLNPGESSTSHDFYN